MNNTLRLRCAITHSEDARVERPAIKGLKQRLQTRPGARRAHAGLGAGLSNSRRIARQRLAIRDSVRKSASAIGRFGISQVQKVST